MNLSNSHAETFNTTEDCTQILKAKYLPTHVCPFILQNSLTPLESRAGPNQRLIPAFGIENCFVTSDSSICNAFRVEAKSLMNLDPERWKKLRNILDKSLAIHVAADKRKIKLVPKVQFLSLKLALHVLCGLEGDDSNDQAIYKLASEINRQWLWSKTATATTRASRLPGIKRTLCQLFPEWQAAGCPAHSNPLNFLLPGYETLWRVVLRGLIEVGFHDSDDGPTHCSILQKFHDNPTVEALNHADGVGGTSAGNIVKEVLRLYPPTRRIYRDYKDQDSGAAITRAADVEALHRNETVWGSDASVFDPSRWSETGFTERTKDSFLAFGASPFPCVARSAGEGFLPFGVAIIALLLGGISAQVNRDGWMLRPTEDEQEVLQAGKLLQTDREAYAHLCAERLD